MRILDLGAHDGFVTNFIARHLKGADLHVDGIEANENGVRIFNERAKRDSIPGECKIGLAEDAFALFEPGSYDAVVAFELIEHVPNVLSFLSVCEQMCKTGGRVYLSTPSGTFGAGNNPHHLRVYRAVDLFDTMRRRGFVNDMFDGPDGVVVGSYTPDASGVRRYERGEVAIFAGAGWEPWSPTDIETKGLGGSETAATKLAEALSDAGCIVTVYGEVAPCAYKQISFRHYSTFDPTVRRDLVIASRTPQLFDRPINAAAKVLWMHDTDYGPELSAERAENMDAIYVLSEWHRTHVEGMYPFTAEKLHITRNGINPNYFLAAEPDMRDPHKAIYTSSPDRGLDFLLSIWPQVRERVSDAKLEFAYATVYDKVAEKIPSIRNFRDLVKGLSDQPGVASLGALTQPAVALAMRSSGVWLAPSYSTPAGQPFNETYCIGAIESAAAGCCRVMSDWGALPERAPQGFKDMTWLVPSVCDGKPDPDLFVEAIVAAMRRAEEGSPPSNEALEQSWAGVATDFLSSLPSRELLTVEG